MKLNKKPCHVIQIFSCSYAYDKKYRNYDLRKSYVGWKSEISSRTSVESEVMISRDSYEKITGVLEDLVVLIDDNFYTYDDYLNLLKLNDQRCDDDDAQLKQYYGRHRARQKSLFLGALGSRAQNIEIFKIRLEGEVELFLNWDYWNVGEPKRENYKIAALKEGVPVNILIDGKRDFSLTGRRKRVYLENNYIIEYKGVFETVSVLNENRVFSKKVPDTMKEVNLLKHLR